MHSSLSTGRITRKTRGTIQTGKQALNASSANSATGFHFDYLNEGELLVKEKHIPAQNVEKGKQKKQYISVDSATSANSADRVSL